LLRVDENVSTFLLAQEGEQIGGTEACQSSSWDIGFHRNGSFFAPLNHTASTQPLPTPVPISGRAMGAAREGIAAPV
jgi:hypothetical protein